MKVLICIVLLVVLFVVGVVEPNSERINNRPIIGVLSQPVNGEKKKFGDSYIAASYVKFLEGAGARVVPINYNWSVEKHYSIFKQINGVLFPGGGADLSEGSPYLETQRNYLNWAIKASQEGDHFPVWATCLGFEALSILTSQDYNILSSFDAWSISLPLEFKGNPSHSRLFNQTTCPTEVIEILQNEAVTLNNHHFGVSVADWFNNKELTSFYNVLSINKDRNGKEFISTIESKHYPVYGVQWHPEKAMYEWSPKVDINHSTNSIKANQYMADFFVKESRKSLHKFESEKEEWDTLIYQMTPIYTYDISSDFIQSYFFKD